MRRCYLVCYDISDAKRWRRIFRAMKGYGEHWQYSVFFCVLKEMDRVRMQSELEMELNLKEDQCIIIDLGANEEMAREAVTVMGESLPKAQMGMVVV